MNEKEAMGKLCQYRHQSGVSQNNTALDAGIVPAHLSCMERGKRTITYKSLCKVAYALGLTVGFVIHDSEGREL